MHKYILILGLAFLTSCAQYQSNPLTTLPSTSVYGESHIAGLQVTARAYTKADCKYFLDRDVIRKGYQPIQVTVNNNTNKTFFFSPDGISLPTVSPKEVAKRVHTSTAGRIAGYGAAALVASPLFAIPAVVDGMKSADANHILDEDFLAKGAKDQLIFPQTSTNMLLFIPRSAYQETFQITLIDETTDQPVKILAHTR
ncbi:MAG: hypothetical protein K940chlam9_00491 [Chlamydiae bacterium]|nr:hypothetical protein [Chlamydiota bacterium]